MIYVGENKALLCKGDSRPAELYKGDKKIAGYTITEFEGENSMVLTDCYNDKVYDAFVHGKNLLDAKKHYGDYANENGGITLHTGQLWDFANTQKSLRGVFKEKTPYTFSCNYKVTEATTVIQLQFHYTDGTRAYTSIGSRTHTTEGKITFTTNGGKTVDYFNFTYGSNVNTIFECELTEMQIEEGTSATDYEPPLTDTMVTARGKNILDMSQLSVSKGYYLDSSGDAQSSNTRFIKISPIAVEPLTQYTISIGSKHCIYSIWFFYGDNSITRVSPYKVKNWTFTTPENCTYIRVSIDSYYSGGTAIPTDLEWAMLEKGEGDGEYEPYIEPQTVNVENGEITADIPTFRGTTVIELDVTATISGSYKKVE